MFKQFVSPTQKELFLKAIESSTCTVQSLLQHYQIAEEIAKGVSFESEQHMKEIILKRWPHLKQVVSALMPGNHLMPAEPRKKSKKSKKQKKSGTPSIPKIILGSLITAMAALAAGAGRERSAYHKEVHGIPSLSANATTNFPSVPEGVHPVDHVKDVLATVDPSTPQGKLWTQAQENSLARTRAQQNHRGGVAGVLAKFFREHSKTKDATIDTLVEKYALRFKGNVKDVVLKIGNPSKTNATADAAAFVFLQILAPVVAVGSAGWTVKMLTQQPSDTDDDEEHVIDEKKNLSKREALALAALLENEYPAPSDQTV